MLRTVFHWHDPEARALRGLARVNVPAKPKRPLDVLQQLAGLAKELTSARYGALVVTDERDNVEGFVVSGLSRDEERRLKSAPLGHGSLGSMRQDGLAVRIDDLAGLTKAFGFPPKHLDMKTLLGVPLDVNGEVRGALYVADRDGGRPFHDDDEVVLRVLARHAGRVIGVSWY